MTENVTADVKLALTRHCLNCDTEFVVIPGPGHPRKFHNAACRSAYRNRLTRINTARRSVSSIMQETQERITAIQADLAYWAFEWDAEDEA